MKVYLLHAGDQLAAGTVASAKLGRKYVSVVFTDGTKTRFDKYDEVTLLNDQEAT